jgi:hypothetical protein
MYLLDGESNFVHTTGIVQFLSENNRMPGMIVVGVSSTDRTRDFTPNDSSIPGSGGAGRFLRCLKNELIPYIESHYETAPFRLLVGHSLGGSFVLNALLTYPELFNAYLIISPNLWWGNDTLVNQLEVFLKKPPKLKAFVYETATRESPKNILATARLWSLIESYPVDGLDWRIQYMQNESHGSIVHRSIYDALEFIFAPWELRSDLSAIAMPGLWRHYQELSDRYGYAIDPDEHLVNALGYQFFFQGKLDEAITVFKWNVRHYPKSSNVYDSLGEAYAKKGDTKLALENYEKSVALNPKNTAAIEIVKKLKSK